MESNKLADSEKTVRVFISSTFRDMHAERDHLVTVVFPELRERIEQLGLEFFDVDLRWGVPEKDANGETANSWEYCRQWIDRVEPFFVCILGQRYGWEPPPEKLKDERERERQRDHPRSITDMEVRHAVLDKKRKRRVVILLDALNQLTDGHDLHWLPSRLGPSVCVNVSCVDDAAAKVDSSEQRVLKALTSRQPEPLRVPLGPLTKDDVRTTVVAYLKEYCHELDVSIWIRCARSRRRAIRSTCW